MRYLLCLKEVPDTKNIEIDKESGSLKRDTVGSRPNSADEYAIACALSLCEKYDGEIIALTLGPKHSRACLRRALSFGATNAYHLLDKAFAGSDVYATALLLATAIKKIGGVDVILTGQSSEDGDTGQVPAALANKLDIPFTLLAERVEIKDDLLYCNQSDLTDQRYAMKFPCLLSIKEGAYSKRESTFKDKMLARKKEITVLSYDDLDIDCEVGYKGSLTRVNSMFAPNVERDKIIKEADIYKDIERLLLDVNNKKTDIEIKRDYPISDKLYSILLAFDNYDIDGFLEGYSHFSKMASNINIDVLGVNISKENIDKIAYLKNIGKIINFESKDDSFISYIEAYKTIDKNKYNFYFALSNAKGRSYLSDYAFRNKIGLTADCTDFYIDDNLGLIQIRPAFSERLYAKIRSVDPNRAAATYRSGVFDIDLEYKEEKSEIENLYLSYSREDIKLISLDKKYKKTVRKSRIVVVIGKGAKSAEDVEMIRNFAKKLDADIYYTRPMIMSGYSSSDKQVGVSGQNISSDLAILIGVSGSTQTLVGLKKVKKILAINSDINANIVNFADIIYIEDWKKIIGG